MSVADLMVSLTEQNISEHNRDSGTFKPPADKQMSPSIVSIPFKSTSANDTANDSVYSESVNASDGSSAKRKRVRKRKKKNAEQQGAENVENSMNAANVPPPKSTAPIAATTKQVPKANTHVR